MTKLIIVESAKKARTIKGMLGAEFVVKATSGHILEMPADDIHVNLQDFTPTLHLIHGKGKKLEELRKAAAQADAVYLGTDMDREGEAIAQHVAERLGRPLANKIRRITFTAITRTDLQAALAAPRLINLKLVEAQTARRVTDRLVGYMVSPVLWKGLSGLRRLSAGRVQSPALWLVVERERAIRAFVSEEWWSIEAELSKTADPNHQKFWATLFKIKGRKPELKTEADAQKVLTDLAGATWRVLNVDKGTRVRKPYPPFTTDSMQQAASSQLGFNPRLTMKIAQELYEGVKLGEGKAVGLITYIRTDSVAVAPEAQQAARGVIAKYFGEAYLPAKPPIYQTRDKTAQEAHEAIRPVDPWKTPKGIEAYLTPPQYQLYRLIWRRFIASQMKPAIYDTITVDIETIIAGSATQYLFRATGSTLRFAGFLKVYGVDADAEESRQKKDKGKAVSDNQSEDGAIENESMPDLSKGDALTLHQLLPKQHFTQPPKRYTEAQLIGALKKLGLGRPSTYATIVETLKDRRYVGVEKKRLYPTPLGFQVCELLERHVQMVIDVGFTAQMEANLDRIANGQANRLAVMREFYDPFKQVVDQALIAAAAERQPAARPPKVTKGKRTAGRKKAMPTSDKVGQVCPECKEGTLVAKQGKYGPFLGCSRYAAGCRFTEKLRSGGRTRRKSTRRKKRSASSA
ncbi:MAG: type I DNA topoisomerase [Anaerolineae bacterium]|nr:type I DNA topoisomerase [Anaerolineae bacterium]